MTMTNEFETDLLNHIFNNATHTDIGDAAGLLASAEAGDIYVSLHTGDPGEAGDQTTSECDYTDYARVAVDRDGAAWTVAAANCSNAAAVTFPACSAGDADVVTHFGLGSATSGAGHLYMSGALSASLSVSVGITPQFAIGELDVNAD